MLAAVAAVAFGLDRGVLTRLSLAGTGGLEQRLVDRFHPASQKKIVLNQTVGVSGAEPTSVPIFPGLPRGSTHPRLPWHRCAER